MLAAIRVCLVPVVILCRLWLFAGVLYLSLFIVACRCCFVRAVVGAVVVDVVVVVVAVGLLVVVVAVAVAAVALLLLLLLPLVLLLLQLLLVVV